jgi:arylsulfatase A-like enzyme
MAQSRPNILFIICHDLGQHLGCYGAGLETPNLDALAADGVVFRNYHCSAAQCSPSRGSIITGRYPHNNGLIELCNAGGELYPGTVTMQMLFRDAGYSTHLIGHQHETPRDPRELGYQHIEFSSGAAKNAAKSAAQWLMQRGRSGTSKPFFLNIGTGEPHRPYHRKGYRVDDPAKVKLLPWLPDRPGIREDIAHLNGLVYALDEAVGEVMGALRASGLADNTLVIFTTDHGLAMPQAKCTCYDPGTKTALIMRLPGRWDGGKVYDQLLVNCDLLPTLLELIGARPPDNLDGRSFLGLLDGGGYTPRNHIFTEMTFHGFYNPMRCIRTRRYKYIRNFADLPLVYMPVDIWEEPAGKEMREEYHGARRPREELYDLEKDPLEMNNLAADPACAEIKGDLRRRLETWMRETGDKLLEGDWPASQNQQVVLRNWMTKSWDRCAEWVASLTPDMKKYLGDWQPPMDSSAVASSRG